MTFQEDAADAVTAAVPFRRESGSRGVVGDRVFHQKFGNGNVVGVDGNKLTIAFDKAGEKRVVDSFVERGLKAPA